MAAYTLNELTKEEEEKLLAEGVAKEIAKVHALGLPTTHADIHGIYHLYPDGTKVYIKDEKEAKEKTAQCKNSPY